MIKCLCKPGAQWTIRGEEAISFSRSELSIYGTAWFNFICAKLMPSSHVSNVIKSRACPLFAIVTVKSINVGKFIYESILHALRGGSIDEFPHPSLICGLYMNAGVVWTVDEIFEQPKAVLDNNIIDRFKEWEGGIPKRRGASYILDDDFDVAAAEATIVVGHVGGAGPSQPAKCVGRGSASPSRVSSDLLLNEVRALRGAIDNLGQGQKQLLRLSCQQTR